MLAEVEESRQTVTLMPEYLVVCCWRSIKEVSLLLGHLCQRVPITQPGVSEGIMTFQQVQYYFSNRLQYVSKSMHHISHWCTWGMSASSLQYLCFFWPFTKSQSRLACTHVFLELPRKIAPQLTSARSFYSAVELVCRRFCQFIAILRAYCSFARWIEWSWHLYYRFAIFIMVKDLFLLLRLKRWERTSSSSWWSPCIAERLSWLMLDSSWCVTCYGGMCALTHCVPTSFTFTETIYSASNKDNQYIEK